MAANGFYVNSHESHDQAVLRHRTDCENRLAQAADHIRHFGVYAEPRPNVLARMSNTALSIVIPAVLATVTTGGLMLGKYTSDVQAFDLKLQVKEYQDSLRFARVDVAALSDTVSAYEARAAAQEQQTKDTVGVEHK